MLGCYVIDSYKVQILKINNEKENIYIASIDLKTYKIALTYISWRISNLKYMFSMQTFLLSKEFIYF